MEAHSPRDAHTANALCQGQQPPRVAHCIVGGARTFPKSQAWRSLRRNLIEAFGGVGLDSTLADVYFQLKLVDDAPKSQREWRFDALDQTHNLASVCAATCAFAPRTVSLLNQSHAGPAPNGESGCFRNGFFANPQNLARAVSQWSSFAECLEDVARAEEAAHQRYDARAAGSEPTLLTICAPVSLSFAERSLTMLAPGGGADAPGHRLVQRCGAILSA